MTYQTKHLYWLTVNASACAYLMACVGAQAETLDPPTIISHHTDGVAQEDGQDKPNVWFDWHTTSTVEKHNEERAPIARKAAIEGATETVVRTAGRFKETFGNQRVASKPTNAHKMGRQESPKMLMRSTSVIKETTLNQRREYLKYVSTHTDDDGLRNLANARASGVKSDGKLVVKRWRKEGKLLSEVFDLVQMENTNMELFENPLLDLLVAYAQLKSKPNNYMLLLVPVLLRKYGEEELVRLVATAKTQSSIAETMERELFVRWKTDKKSIHDVFLLLGLDKLPLVDLLNDPKLSMWFAYAQFRKRNPFELMISAIETKSIDLKRFNDILAAAKERGGNGEILEKLQFELWKQGGVDVFVFLKLDEEGDKVLESPAWSTWVSYLNYLGGNHDELMLSKFKKFSDESLEKIITSAKARGTRKLVQDLQELLFEKRVEKAFSIRNNKGGHK